jgi:hypothetical protein
MKIQLLKKVMLGVAMITQLSFCFAQDSEETLNQKYWTMRERFRKYYVSIGKDAGQGIPNFFIYIYACFKEFQIIF